MNGERDKIKSWDDLNRTIPLPCIFYKDQYGRTYCWTEPSSFPEEAPDRIEKKDGRVLRKLLIDKTIYCYDEEST